MDSEIKIERVVTPLYYDTDELFGWRYEGKGIPDEVMLAFAHSGLSVWEGTYYSTSGSRGETVLKVGSETHRIHKGSVVMFERNNEGRYKYLSSLPLKGRVALSEEVTGG